MYYLVCFCHGQSTPCKRTCMEEEEALKCASVVIHVESQGHYLKSTNVIFTYFNLFVSNKSLFLFSRWRMSAFTAIKRSTAP